MILKARPEDCTTGALYLLELFVSLVQEWIEFNAKDSDLSRPAPNFAHALEGKSDALLALRRQLSLFGWEKDCRKQILVVSPPPGQNSHTEHLSSQLVGEGHGVYVTLFQKRLVFLCSMDLAEQNGFSGNLSQFLRDHRCCGASSLCFTNLDQMLKFYHQALTTLEHRPQVAGTLYRCQDVAMRIVLKVVDEYGSATLLHPALTAMKEYDQAHKTEYCRTLFCYLKNESRHQQTAEELFIHRNTLSQRMEKIQELWPLDLNDPEERFYLLFFFVYSGAILDWVN